MDARLFRRRLHPWWRCRRMGALDHGDVAGESPIPATTAATITARRWAQTAPHMKAMPAVTGTAARRTRRAPITPATTAGIITAPATGVNGTEHTGYYGTTTTSSGAYYHQPATVNYYGNNCYNCGGGGAWGAAAAGAAVGAAAGVAVGAAAATAAAAAPVVAYAPPPPPPAYAILPAGCVFRILPNRYECGGGVWLAPAYGANGVYYQVVPPP